MRFLPCLLSVAALVAGCAGAQHEPSETSAPALTDAPAFPASVSFSWPTPAGWRSERIPFPLAFAPSLPYQGAEELRFAPRFFKPDSETYFTYSLAFVLEPNAERVVPFTTDQLAADVRAYFRGLTAAVTHQPQDADAHDATIHASTKDPSRYTGEVRTIDGFGDHRPLRLHLEGETVVCQGRRVILASLSPRAATDPIWPQLAAQRATFVCSPS